MTAAVDVEESAAAEDLSSEQELIEWMNRMTKAEGRVFRISIRPTQTITISAQIQDARGKRRQWLRRKMTGLLCQGFLAIEEQPKAVITEISEYSPEIELLRILTEATSAGANMIALESLGSFLELKRAVSELGRAEGKGQHPNGFANVNTLYKTVAKKVRPAAVELPSDAWDRIQRARAEPRLRDAKSIGHIFTDASLKTIRISNGDHGMLTNEEKEEFRTMIGRHGRAFAFEKSEIGCVDPSVVPPMIIFTVPHVPWNLKPIPVPRAHFSQLLELLRDRLQERVIERSSGPYASRWFTVPKKNGKLRFIQDLQPANKVTIRDAGVGPLLEEYVEEFAGRSIYSMGDLFSGYDQFQLERASRDITAIKTPLGLMRMTVVPMGGTNSVSHLTTAMNHVLEEFIPRVTRPFIDDLPFRGCATAHADESNVRPGIRRFVADHMDDIDRILARLEEVGLTLSAEKSEFGLSRINVVGFVCSREGRSPDHKKLQSIEAIAACETVAEVRRFLGAVGFYRMFIPHFATLAEPLFELLRKGTIFDWTERCENAMVALKDALTRAPVLRPLSYDKLDDIILTVDASPVGAGWVLSQESDDGRHPARFGAKVFGDAQRRYGQTKRELLAVKTALLEERVYVTGRRIIVETDCSALVGMTRNGTTPDPHMQRWIGVILQFDLEIRHIRGSENAVADMLSRARWKAERVELNVESKDAELESYWQNEEQNESAKLNALTIQAVGTRLGCEDLDKEPFREDLYVGKYHEIGRYLEWQRTGGRGKSNIASDIRRKALGYFLADGHLWKRPGADGNPRRVVCNADEQRAVLAGLHDDEAAGHRGIWSTYVRVRERFTWGRMFDSVKNYVRSCAICQRYSEGKDRDTMALMVPSRLHRQWFLDIVSMPRSSDGHVCFVEAREELSNFVEARALRSKKSEPVGRFVLEDIIARYGCIEILRGDGGELNDQGVRELLARYGIQIKLTTPYNPGANGKAERGHRSLLGILRKSCDGRMREWAHKLPLALWADRTTVSRTTGYMPAELLTGTRPVFPIDEKVTSWAGLAWTDGCSTEDLVALRARQLEKREVDLERAIDRIREEREATKEAVDAVRSTRTRVIEEGEWVLVRNDRIYNEFRSERKLLPRWFGPYVVTNVNRATRTYALRELDGTPLKSRCSGTRIRLFRRRDGTIVVDNEEANTDKNNQHLIREEDEQQDEEELEDFDGRL